MEILYKSRASPHLGPPAARACSPAPPAPAATAGCTPGCARGRLRAGGHGAVGDAWHGVCRGGAAAGAAWLSRQGAGVLWLLCRGLWTGGAAQRAVQRLQRRCAVAAAQPTLQVVGLQVDGGGQVLHRSLPQLSRIVDAAAHQEGCGRACQRTAWCACLGCACTRALRGSLGMRACRWGACSACAGPAAHPEARRLARHSRRMARGSAAVPPEGPATQPPRSHVPPAPLAQPGHCFVSSFMSCSAWSYWPWNMRDSPMSTLGSGVASSRSTVPMTAHMWGARRWCGTGLGEGARVCAPACQACHAACHSAHAAVGQEEAAGGGQWPGRGSARACCTLRRATQQARAGGVQHATHVCGAAGSPGTPCSPSFALEDYLR